ASADQRVDLVKERQVGRQKGEGADPAERHADQADDPELPEAAEAGYHERAVREGGAEGRGDGRPGGRAERDPDRARVLAPLTPLLHVARQDDDSDVDPV